MKLVQTVETRPEVSASFEQKKHYWRKFLRRQFALAPTHVIKLGTLTEEEYLAESQRYADHDLAFMGPWLSWMKQYRGPIIAHETFYHFGLGEGDDATYIPMALNMGFDVEINEIVETGEPGIQRAIQRINHIGQGLMNIPKAESLIRQVDFEETVASANFGPHTVSGCKIGRLFQHYEKAPLREIVLDMASLVSIPGKIIFATHHLPEFNPGYDYTTSVECPLDNIMGPIREIVPKAEVLNQKTMEQDTLNAFCGYENISWLAIGQP